MFFHKLEHVIESQAGAFVQSLGGEEGLKDRGQMLWRDAGASVGHGQTNGRQPAQMAPHIFELRQALVARGGDKEAAALGHGVTGIEGEVQKGLAKLEGIQIERQRKATGSHLHM